jgi:ABC-type transport system involved in cytochrome c biogenesis permease component
MNLTKFQRDLVERVVRTFAQAALAVIAVQLASPTFTVDSLQATGVAAVAAGLSALMGLAGKFVGDPDSGSWDEAA